MPEPAAEVIDRHPVQQVVPCVAMPQRMSAYALSRRDRAHLLCSFHRGLHPAPGRRGMHFDYPALPHASIRERTRERRVQLRVYRHQARLAALARPDPERGMRTVKRQIAHFEIKRLGHSQPGAPLFEHKELRLRVGGETDDGVDLVRLQILRQFLDALGSRAILGLGIPSARPAAAYNLSRQGQNPPM